jgi:hypothetical protein
VPATIHASELPPEIAKTVGVPAKHRAKPKGKPARLSKDAVRSFAIRCLSPLSELTRADRARVLNHAQKVNRL